MQSCIDGAAVRVQQQLQQQQQQQQRWWQGSAMHRADAGSIEQCKLMCPCSALSMVFVLCYNVTFVTCREDAFQEYAELETVYLDTLEAALN
jgi:hypothetical protein